MTLKKEYQVFSVNPDKGINGVLHTVDDPAFLNWFFGTDNLIFPKYYAGCMPVRVMCKYHPSSSEFPTIHIGDWEAPLTKGPVMIFGSTPKGWQRSLTDEEVKHIESLGGLVCVNIDARNSRVGYSLARFNDSPDIQIWKEDE